MLHWLQKKRYWFSPFSIKKILCKYRRFILVQWRFWSNMIKFQQKTIYSIFHFVKTSDVCPCYIVHSRATKNPIHLWLAFPILDNCGVCHFEEIEYRQKKEEILSTSPFVPYQKHCVKTCFSCLSPWCMTPVSFFHSSHRVREVSLSHPVKLAKFRFVWTFEFLGTVLNTMCTN